MSDPAVLTEKLRSVQARIHYIRRLKDDSLVARLEQVGVRGEERAVGESQPPTVRLKLRFWKPDKHTGPVAHPPYRVTRPGSHTRH